jgi:hypothetical protein
LNGRATVFVIRHRQVIMLIPRDSLATIRIAEKIGMREIGFATYYPGEAATEQALYSYSILWHQFKLL